MVSFRPPREYRRGGQHVGAIAVADIGVLDLCGLKCPLPSLLVRRALLRSPPGTLIEVLADDPMARVDLPHLCHQEGFELVSAVNEGNAVRFRLRRPSPNEASGAP